jgi:hypothetical protein
MKVLINPTIVISNPIKNKQLGYTATIDKKNSNFLSIKCKSFSGRKRGTVAQITKDGDIIIVQPELTNSLLYFLEMKNIKSKLDLTLDLIYGKNRKMNCVVNNNGFTNFNKSL